MNSAHILIQDTAPYRIIRIQRAERANALNAEMMESIAHAVHSASTSGARAIVLMGEGAKAFCAGADIKEFIQGEAQLQAQEHGLQHMILAMADSPLPIVAAVHGKTMGAGAMLMAMSDLVIASSNLEFGIPEIRFNMYPAIVHAVMMEKLPATLANQLCLTGRMLDADQAQSIGLVSEILKESSEGFQGVLNDRLQALALRLDGLEIAHRANRLIQTPQSLRQRLSLLSPLLMENFSRPGVREGIVSYMQGLGNKSAKVAG
jgi:enoyl-CoA hydratase/carnithine racemase